VLTEITFRPIDQWPDGWHDEGRGATRQPGRFRSTYDQTTKLLREELEALDATTGHVQLDITSAQLRQDGMLRARAVVGHPGVIVTVVTPDRTLVLRTDRFYSPWYGVEDWHLNLRAIALGLVDLRRMDRYGLNDDGAQYAGFAALPPARAMGAGMTVEQAHGLLRGAAGVDGDDSRSWHDLYRLAARRTHPDAGGDAERFRELTAARDLLAATGRDHPASTPQDTPR
jgi:hypothetical protein